MRFFFVMFITTMMTFSFLSNVNAEEVKQGDEITIVTPGTTARLCPYPNCPQNQHITRIPKGTTLKIEGIKEVKSGVLTVQWFEVTYKGKKGWVSTFDTDDTDKEQ